MTMLRSSLPIMVSMACFLLFAPAALFSQGETTSAIVGQVTDATSAAIPRALITKPAYSGVPRPMSRGASIFRS
jgi:hypothetical protein